MDNYLLNRTLLYDTEDGKVKKNNGAGIYSESQSLEHSEWWPVENRDTTVGILFRYTDDVAVLITARNLELAEYKINQIIQRIWRMDGRAHANFDQFMLLTMKCINNILKEQEVQVGEAIVQTALRLK